MRTDLTAKQKAMVEMAKSSRKMKMIRACEFRSTLPPFEKEERWRRSIERMKEKKERGKARDFRTRETNHEDEGHEHDADEHEGDVLDEPGQPVHPILQAHHAHGLFHAGLFLQGVIVRRDREREREPQQQRRVLECSLNAA